MFSDQMEFRKKYKLPISVTILTKNSAKYLQEVLQALELFDEVLIYDNGSEDATLAIAQQFSNISTHLGPFYGFGPTHNGASNLAKNGWILSIDSDEVVTPALAEEIAAIALQRHSVYSIARNNYYNGKWIRWCGWYPDRQVRLYHRADSCFSSDQVHEGVVTQGLTVIPLSSPIRHYSYACTADFLAKMQHYSSLFAEQNSGKKRATVFSAIGHALFAFFKSYFLKRGLLGGYEGFVISIYNSNTALYKYLKLREYNKKNLNNYKKGGIS